MCLLSWSCGGNATDNSLKIAGGTAHLKVMGEIGAILQAKTPGLTISINGGGSGVGIKSVGEEMVNIGNSGRELTPDEIRSYGLVPHRIAIDGIAVVVHPDNPVDKLTIPQLADIFTKSHQVGMPLQSLIEGLYRGALDPQHGIGMNLDG